MFLKLQHYESIFYSVWHFSNWACVFTCQEEGKLVAVVQHLSASHCYDEGTGLNCITK